MVKGPDFNSQHPHGGSQPSLSSVLGSLMSSSDLRALSTDMVYMHMHQLASVSIAVIKHSQSSLGRKGLILLTLPHHSPSLKKVRAGTYRQEAMQRPWSSATYWLAPGGFLSLPS